MKKLLAVLIFVYNCSVVFAQDDFKFPTESDYPKLLAAARSFDEFVPQNWKLKGKATGDLNGDKIQDAVLVVQGTRAEFIQKNDGLGGDEFNTNPRMLIIIFKNAPENRYELIEQSKTFIITPDSPTMTEPFQSVKIRNGVLQLDFEIFYSAGSWGTSQSSYKFKYINGEFALIGADKIESMRNTGETETRSYNFLTNKMSVTTKNFSDDAKVKTKRKTYRVGKLKTFRTFAKPFDWEIERDYFL
jgi:hypothetical protein